MPTTVSTWLRRPGDHPPLLVEDFNVSTDLEYVRSSGAALPDMDWSYTDPAGHVHRFVQQGDEGADITPEWLPTLIKERLHIDCDGSCWAITHRDCDGVDVPVWFCRECRAEVEPGFVPDDAIRSIGFPITQTTTYTVVVRSAERLPEEIETAEIVVIGETTWPLSDDPREDIRKIPAKLRVMGDEMVSFGSSTSTEFTTTYVAQELTEPPRRRMRL